MPINTTLLRRSPCLDNSAREYHGLLEDFSGAQIASKAHLARGAKYAAHGATRLRRNASRLALIIVWHQDRFNELVVLKTVNALFRAVAALLPRNQIQTAERRRRHQLRPQLAGQVSHSSKALNALVIQPMPDLLRPKALFAEANDEVIELVSTQCVQVQLRSPCARVARKWNLSCCHQSVYEKGQEIIGRVRDDGDYCIVAHAQQPKAERNEEQN